MSTPAGGIEEFPALPLVTPRQLEESTTPEALTWLLLSEAFLRVRRQPPTVQQKVFDALNPAQQALFGFYVYYGHASTPTEFVYRSRLYLNTPGMWPRLVTAAEFVDDRPLLDVLRTIATHFESDRGEAHQARIPTTADRELHAQYVLVAQSSWNRLLDYALDHLDEYVTLPGKYKPVGRPRSTYHERH